MSTSVIWSKQFDDNTGQFEIIEFNIVQLENENPPFTHLATVENEDEELTYRYTKTFNEAKNFILGALFTLNRLGIISATEYEI